MCSLCKTHKRSDGSGRVSFVTVVGELLKLDYFRERYEEIKKER